MSTTVTVTVTAQVTMEEAIKQLVELAEGYASYAKKSTVGVNDYLSFNGNAIRIWVNFVNDVWFVQLGKVEITTNASRITFPYDYTINDLVGTYTLYASYLDKLKADAEAEAERIAEIERLKSKLAELEAVK